MVLIILTIVLVFVILLAAAFLGGVYAYLKNPPKITAEVFLPAKTVSREFAKPAPKLDPIPQEILDYIDVESEDHARRGRRARVTTLYNELGDWQMAFAALQREDVS